MNKEINVDLNKDLLDIIQQNEHGQIMLECLKIVLFYKSEEDSFLKKKIQEQINMLTDRGQKNDI